MLLSQVFGLLLFFFLDTSRFGSSIGLDLTVLRGLKIGYLLSLESFSLFKFECMAHLLGFSLSFLKETSLELSFLHKGFPLLHFHIIFILLEDLAFSFNGHFLQLSESLNLFMGLLLLFRGLESLLLLFKLKCFSFSLLDL